MESSEVLTRLRDERADWVVTQTAVSCCEFLAKRATLPVVDMLRSLTEYLGHNVHCWLDPSSLRKIPLLFSFVARQNVYCSCYESCM
ncbi:hypothetical protein CA54_54960 [Symmachiella macrocystis]|uniref:Uncharacterized protein n=1 Tax=Symmachiella macrocystis TaxID=2527985 RepID=A0A5C6B6F0_9PLAN|nr:hypothetical protein CA54_54960 [Symmachiella macrocystis]